MKKLLLLISLSLSSISLLAQTIGFGTPMKHPRKYFGLNGSNVWRYQNGLREPNLDNNLAEMGINQVRFLGGTYTMYFDWLTGKLLTTEDILHGYSKAEFSTYVPEPANTIDAFKDVAGSEVADMLFNVNVLTSSYNQQRAGILYAKVRGQRVRGVEMGNEFYNNGLNGHQEFTYSFPTAISYADTVNKWIDNLRATFGDKSKLPIAVVGADQAKDNDNNTGEAERVNTWLDKVLSQVQWGNNDANAITIHRYTGSGYDDLVLGTNIIKMKRFLYRPHLNFKKLFDLELAKIRANPNNIKVWLTEYGMFDKQHEVHGTWAHGLFVARQTLTYLADTLIELVDVHSMLGDASFGCVFGDATGFDLPKEFNDNWLETDSNQNEDSLPEENPITYLPIVGEKTAVGNTLNLVSQAMRFNKTRTPMVFTGVDETVVYPNIVYIVVDGDTIPYHEDNDTVFTSKLLGWKFSGFYDRDYIIVNSSGSSIDLQQTQIFAGENSFDIRNYTTITANPLDYIRGNATDTTANPVISLSSFRNSHVPYRRTGSLNGTGTLTILPYSVTYIKCELSSVSCCDPVEILLSSYEDNKAVPTSVSGYLKVTEGKGPYTWTSTDGLNTSTGTTDNIKITPVNNTSTNKTITYSVYDAGKSRTSNVTLTVLPKSKIEILLGTDSVTTVTTCDNDCINLNVTNVDASTGNNQYQWYRVDGSLSANGATQNVTICPKKQTNKYYVIGYSGSTGTQIYAIDSVTVTSNAWAEARPSKIEKDETSVYLCNGGTDTVKLGTPAMPPNTYAWSSTNGFTSSLAQPTVTQPGTYTLTVTGNGCTETSSIVVAGYSCCSTGGTAIRMPAYSKMSDVSAAIAANSGCTGCVTGGGKVITNFDGNVYFNGPLISDGKYTFDGCDNLKFATDAQMRIRNQNTVTINNSKLTACLNTGTWNGIHVKTAQEEFIIDSNNITKSTKGIQMNNNALFTITNNSFDANHTSLQFTKYGGNMQGVWRNKFNNSYTPNGNPVNSTHLILTNCPGYIEIGRGVDANLDSANTFTFTGSPSASSSYIETCILANASGLKANNNIFNTFTRGITISNPKTYHNYFIEGNTFKSKYRYGFSLQTTYNMAIYAYSTASVTPEKFNVVGNTLDSCKIGIYLSNINRAKIDSNNITLRKPASGSIYNHYGIYTLNSTNDTIRVNTIQTNGSTFTNLSATDKAKYTGTYLQAFQSGSITDNDISNFARHIEFNGSSQFNRVLCNLFKRGLPNSDITTPTNTFYLNGSANLDFGNFGANDYASNNYWDDFTTTSGTWNERFRGASVDPNADQIPFFYQLTNISSNKYRPFPSTLNLVDNNFNATATNSCNQGTGGINALIVSNNQDAEHAENDVTKSGDSDSTIVNIIENYEPTFTVNSDATDFFADMANFSAGMAYASEGLADSTVIEQNYIGTISGDVMDLNEAVLNNDSISITTISSALPKNNLMLDNLVIMANYELMDSLPTASDSTTWKGIAYTRVLEGGPAVVYFRNRLEIIVDEETLPPSNSQRRAMNGNNYQTSIYPNPSTGTMTIITNTDASLQLEVYDITGKLVYQNQQIKNQMVLDLSNLENGIYAVYLRNGKTNLQTFKWVLSK